MTVKANGGGHKLAGFKYHQYYYNCPLTTSSKIPSHVSIADERCIASDNYIPITQPVKQTSYVHEFGVCVPIAFNFIDPYRIVEWIEAFKILGVTEFNVYHVHMAEESLKVFQHYVDEGVLHLYHIPSAPVYVNSRDGNKIASPISLNDCMYRNMYRYRWAIVIDIDELIVPRTTENLGDMITAIDKKNKITEHARAYMMMNTYFWSNCNFEHPDGIPDKSFIMKLHKHAPPSKPLYASKSIINPRRCLSVFNHYCYHRFKIPKGEKWTITVDAELARSHHYREKYGKDKCDDLLKTVNDDRTIEKYTPQLLENYSKHIKILGL